MIDIIDKAGTAGAMLGIVASLYGLWSWWSLGILKRVVPISVKEAYHLIYKKENRYKKLRISIPVASFGTGLWILSEILHPIAEFVSHFFR
ncbi:hypothetical protein [Shimazuella kribbensis]|uniref:hypothetical protein n=1 Tax=Shimazuella kribbensis TaxID=139808 RepID=UPI0004911DCE|nr:hypothetical protein [Shimazuella kribbensis]